MGSNPLIQRRGNRGYCQLRATACEGFTENLEFHHESYDPSPKQAKLEGKGLNLCHKCHNTVHFRPYLLTDGNKLKLIIARLGAEGRVRAAKGEIDINLLAASYTPPRME